MNKLTRTMTQRDQYSSESIYCSLNIMGYIKCSLWVTKLHYVDHAHSGDVRSDPSSPTAPERTIFPSVDHREIDSLCSSCVCVRVCVTRWRCRAPFSGM